MENANIKKAGIRLPIGYRFRPTDEELVVHYLKRKVMDVPLPALVIPQFDVFLTHPLCFPGDVKEKRYFFTKRIGNEASKNKRVEDGSGCWKHIGKGKQVVSCFNHQVVGTRRTLVFCQTMSSKLNKRSITQRWIMHEFNLVDSQIIQAGNSKIGEWVIYRVFQRKNRPKKDMSNTKRTRSLHDSIASINPSFIDFSKEYIFDNVIGPPLLPCSPCSSGITHEVSANYSGLDLDHEEISSPINFSI